MTSPTAQPIVCRVVDGNKLPASSGGADALCAAIRQAVDAGAMKSRFDVEVRVLGQSSLSATLTTASGKTLPVQKFAASDRALTRTSFERFAQALVDAAAKAETL
jgi:hypothetical protein